MSTRSLRAAARASLILLGAVILAWIWSYVEGRADAYRAAVADAAQRLHQADHESLARLEAWARPDSSWTALQAHLEARLRELRRPFASRPYHSLPLPSTEGVRRFLVSSCGTIALVEYIARPTPAATDEPVLVVPGVWKVAGHVFCARPPLSGGYVRTADSPIYGWQLSQRSFGVHYGMLCPLALVAPSLYLWAGWRDRRLLRWNICPVCRYDLRASPVRCPECGTPRVGVQRVVAEKVS